MAGGLNAMETGSLGRRGLGGRKYLMEVNMTEEAEQLWPDCNDLHHKCESEGRQDWDSKKRKKVGISLCNTQHPLSLAASVFQGLLSPGVHAC